MQNLISIWKGLDLRRRMIVAGATLAVFLAILALSRMSDRDNMVLLYAGLDDRTAGEVVKALDQRGISYAVSGSAIEVPEGERDGLRLALAAEGLPAAGGSGYELLDSLSGFGTTSEMFDAAYWRAKEGELARTILSMPGVRQARVHIAQGPTDPFRRDARPTASVTVTTASGRLGADQATALRHLVASAVAGMGADDVQIIDSVAGLIAGPAAEGGTGGGAALDRAEAIRHGVERLLAARVGPGRSVVEVAVELVTEREQITERKFDPQGRVAISSETEERSQQNTDPGGAVTVASNLPDGDAAGGPSSQSSSSENRERVNFEVSETQRELMRTPGGIRRMTVAVLVDGQLTPPAEGGAAVWTPRPEEELAALRELVASAVGLDESRGDVLTLKSLEFQTAPVEGSPASAGLLPDLSRIDPMLVIQLVILALVALALGLFVIRPILGAGQRAALPRPGPPLALPGIGAGPAALAPDHALTGEIDDGFSLPDLPVVDFTAMPDESPADRLRRLIGERQAESIEILRSWLEPDEERA